MNHVCVFGDGSAVDWLMVWEIHLPFRKCVSSRLEVWATRGWHPVSNQYHVIDPVRHWYSIRPAWSQVSFELRRVIALLVEVERSAYVRGLLHSSIISSIATDRHLLNGAASSLSRIRHGRKYSRGWPLLCLPFEGLGHSSSRWLNYWATW